MNYKKYLMFAFIILDIFFFLWIIENIGVRIFAKFSLWYLIGISIITIILGLMKQITDEKLKNASISSLGSVNYIKVGYIIIYLLFGTLLLFYNPSYPLKLGIATGILVGSHLIFFCKDFLYMIIQYKNILETALEDKYPKWLK